MNVFLLERKNSGLRKYHEARRSNRAEHGRLFLKAEESARGGAHGRHHNLQCRRASMRDVALARQHRSQFGQDLGRE